MILLKNKIKVSVFLCMIVSFLGYSQQEKTIKRYYVKFVSEDAAPKFVKENGQIRYVGDDKEEEAFFVNYDIHNFEQAYPNSKRSNLRNSFFLETTSKDIAANLLKKFPEKYSAIDDITDFKIELLSTPYYPDDFVTSSVRIPTQMDVYDRSELEFINAPKAWGITESLNTSILIGISDAKIDDKDDEFDNGKVTFINYTFGNTVVDCEDIESVHGTGVAAIAAAEGDNNYGSTGVCYDCDLLATDYGYSNLLDLAINGAKVINMSWGYKSQLPPDLYTPLNNFTLDGQEIVNEIVYDYGVVLVAAAGNRNSFNSNGANLRYEYPASYDNVISVTGVNHWFDVNDYPADEDIYTPPNGQIYVSNIEDSVANLVDISQTEPRGVYSQYWAPNTTYMQTLNEEVDICSPGYQIMRYATQLYNCPTNSKYGSSTSQATPYVTGTIGLMLMVNECLTPNEVENVLKLTTKDIEVNPLNKDFIGYIGAGKLETGNAVEFVDEMQKYDGLAVIKNHTFYRYDFNLDKFNNDLLIENVQFTENTTVDFKANNSIELREGTTLEPGVNGYVILNTDATINDICVPTNTLNSTSSENTKGTLSEIESKLILYPNPTRDIVQLQLVGQDDKIASVQIYNIHGHLISEITSLKNNSLNISNFKKGIYLIKVQTINKSLFTEKVIKM